MGGGPDFPPLLAGVRLHGGKEPRILPAGFEQLRQAGPCVGIDRGVAKTGFRGEIGEQGGFHPLGVAKTRKVTPGQGSSFAAGEKLASAQ